MRYAPLVTAGLLLALVGCTSPADPLPTVPALHEQTDLGPDDGYVQPGTWLTLDDTVPAIANLDHDLRAALDLAAAAAEERGTELSFTDGWRSERYQQYLFDNAVANYGSEEEARRWVKQPDESNHVLGKAVDVATADAMDFLNRFGAEFGLCQIYSNEAWHFEYVPGVTETCPPQLQDSTG